MSIKLELPKIIPSQPTDVFEWTRRCRIAAFDGYQPPLYPDRNYDARLIVDTARELRADTIRISAMGKLAHFNTDQWETDAYVRSHDYIGEVIEYAHEHGLRVAVYVPGAHHLPFDLLKKWHPEWIQRAYPGQPPEEAANKYHAGTLNAPVCPIGPYRDFYRAMVEKVVLGHDLDAWYTDGWGDCYFNTSCYCEACRGQFLSDTGSDLYSNEYLPGGARRQDVLDWYHKKLVKMVQEIYAMVMAKKRLPAIINQLGGVLGYQPEGPWAREIDAMHDVAHFERKTDPYNRLVSASYLNIKGERAWFYAGIYSPLHVGTPTADGEDFAERNYADERVFPFRKELYNECFIPFACGQAVNSYRCNSLVYDTDSPGKALMKDIFGLVADNPGVFEGTSYYPYIGILSRERERYRFLGPILRGLVLQGIQATIFKKEDICDPTFLKKFAVLITDRLDNEELEHMLELVKDGGRWITCGAGWSPISLGAAELPAPEGFKAYLLGRGIIVQAPEDMSAEGLMPAVEYASGGYLPYRVRTGSGELMPILAAKKGLWALHLVNVTRHLTGKFEAGLETIPAIQDIEICLNIPDGYKTRDIRMLRNAAAVSAEKCGSLLKVRLDKLEEYDALVVEFV